MTPQPDNADLKELIRDHPAFPRECPGCERLLDAGETCPVCSTFARLRKLYHERRCVGSFINLSHPESRPSV